LNGRIHSKILVFGGTGYIGKLIVKASTEAGHPSHVCVVGENTVSHPEKSKLIETFKTSGVTILLCMCLSFYASKIWIVFQIFMEIPVDIMKALLRHPIEIVTTFKGESKFYIK